MILRFPTISRTRAAHAAGCLFAFLLAITGCGTHHAVLGPSRDAEAAPNGGHDRTDAAMPTTGPADPGLQVGAPDAGSDAGAPPEANPDAGTDVPADPCMTLPNKCTQAGAMCTGNTLVTCAANEAGCLVTTRTNCTRNGTNFCDSASSPPACAVDPCAGLPNACTNEGVSCNGTTLVTCAKNSAGCLVSTRTDCTGVSGKNTCSGRPAACQFDACRDAQGRPKPDVCATPNDSCAGDYWVHCVPDSDGCAIATRTNCTQQPNKNMCDATAQPPACGFDPCKGVTNCLTQGKTCDGVNLIDCAPNANGCLVKTTTDCTQHQTMPLTCDASSGTAACSTCNNAAGCVGKVEGATLCDANVFQRCSDTDGDTCLNAVREDCGTQFTCNADPTKRCVYTGADSCSSAIAATLREPMSYGPFDTTGAGDEYSAYTCPGLFFGVQATSPDLLFAVDVAAKSVVTISLRNASGFTGNGASLFLLTRCADNPTTAAQTAEASCQTVSSDSLVYANETATSTRVYVVADANRVNNADNVGMFGLTLDVRPLTCGDGRRDGSEACDDGNIASGDGCTPTCTREPNFSCTSGNPSICTRRPSDGICANVTCPMLPSDAPSNTQTCCTTDERCGVAYSFFYGAGCFVRDQPGKEVDACPDEASVFAPFVPALLGCCRPDNTCGVITVSGAGCVERSDAWAKMLDGFGSFLYRGPFASMPCTY